MAQCATTALAGALPRPCVRGARGGFGGLGPVPGVVSLPFPPSRPACPALRVAGRLVRVSLTLARWYAIPRGLCVQRARSGCPSGSPRVPFACVCARAPAAPAPPPPWAVWRAHLARSRHWALVGPLHVVRAPSRVLPRSLAPSGVLRGGRSGPGSPLPGLGLRVCGQALPLPRLSALWAGCRGPSSTLAMGAGVRVWGPGAVSSACMPCRGRAPRGWWGPSPGGWPATVARGVWCQALSLPRSPALWAGRRGPPPTCCGRGCAGVGARHCPLGLHALWELRAAGVVGGRPRGGWPATVVRGVWCQTLSLPQPPALWGG